MERIKYSSQNPRQDPEESKTEESQNRKMVKTLNVEFSGNHNHSRSLEDLANLTGDYGINPLIKIKVDDLIRLGLTNNEILDELEVLKTPESIIPTHKQLSNRRFYYKRSILCDLKDTTKGAYEKWVEENRGDLATSGENDFLILSSHLQDQDFMLLVTTKGLLRNALAQAEGTGASYVATDATHKLISCGFKFSTIATVTMQQEIADIAYLIHAHEDYKSYGYAFQKIQDTLQAHFQFNWKPQYTMSDFSPVLRKAFAEIFPDAFQGKCYYHLKQNVKKKFRKIFKHLEKYLEELSNCIDYDQLKSLWKLVKKDVREQPETSEIADDFLNYFEKEYLHEHYNGWYMGALPPGFGNTNNSLEGHHRYLKEQIFHYKMKDIRKLTNVPRQNNF